MQTLTISAKRSNLMNDSDPICLDCENDGERGAQRTQQR